MYGADTQLNVSGVVTGVSTPQRLKKTGVGTVKLTGGDDITRSKLLTLWATAGDVVLDGAHIELTSTGTTSSTVALSVHGGDVTLQNGADVQITGNTGIVEDSTLTLTGSGSLLRGPQLDAGEFSGTTANIVVENDA